MKKLMKILIPGFFVIIFLVLAITWFLQDIQIQSVVLTSPNNLAFQENIKINLNKPSALYVRYWIKGSDEKFRTTETAESLEHTAHLMLLQTDTTYEYQIVMDHFMGQSSKIFSFHTPKQSPWLKIPWISQEQPHDQTALGDGLIMLCYGRIPGYIAMVDGKGQIRWYWQINDIGIRAATFTPQGTILAMLRPPKTDAIDDTPKSEVEILNELHVPMRRGSMGFAGGTAIAEIDLTGKMLWRIDLDKLDNSEFKVIHHDVLKDKRGYVHTLYRPKKIINMAQIGGSGIDTLGGDGILVIDSTGREIHKWSVWDHWDIKKDPFIKRFAYDRFHMNSLIFDKDSNYLVSVAVEDQIWKINSKSGQIMWKFGKNGDFKMDTSAWFSFQHSINLNSRGELMLFDNNLFKKESRALSFDLDSRSKSAITKINAPLPKSKYTSRMGSAYLLPNGNLLQTSAKTGTVMVTTDSGKILWELHAFFVPYRSEYVPEEFWRKYFKRE